jgi:hypothetical protein
MQVRSYEMKRDASQHKEARKTARQLARSYRISL